MGSSGDGDEHVDMSLKMDTYDGRIKLIMGWSCN